MPTRRRSHLLLAAALSAAIAGCGDDGDDDPAQPAAEQSHVHGLDVDPRGGALLVATHAGLFRADADDLAAEPVGDARPDLMGFTVAGPRRFLASGHPDPRDGAPPFLGLVESGDGGRTWEPVALEGEVDFHVLEADGERIYGFGSEYDSGAATFRISNDGGRTWDERNPPEPLFSLAIDPDDPDRAVAAGEQALYRTDDAGETWRPLGGPPGLLSWPAPGELYTAAPGGAVARSTDGGDTFSQTGTADGDPAAFHAARGGELFLALHDGTLQRSTDGGSSWEERVPL